VRIQFKALSEDYEWQWLYKRAKATRCDDTQGIVAYSETGRILGILAADNFSPDICYVHLAIDSPWIIKHGFLHEIGNHLFNICGRSHIFAMVSAKNNRSLKFSKHVGFNEACRIPDGMGTGTDYVVLRMDRADCRWITHEKEQEVA
jgi:L-amino acid N-acyltransferase YncA